MRDLIKRLLVRYLRATATRVAVEPVEAFVVTIPERARQKLARREPAPRPRVEPTLPGSLAHRLEQARKGASR